MSIRQEELLGMLLQVDHHLPIKSLAQALSCSEKTVRNDASAINSLFKRKNIRACIEGKRGSGILLRMERECDRAEVASLAQRFSFDEEQRPAERHARIMLAIACSDERPTMGSLAKTLYTNKQKLRDDLHVLEAKCEPFHVSLSKGRSLALQGSEEDVRAAIASISCVDLPTETQTRINEEFVRKEHRGYFKEMIGAIEDGKEFRVSANARTQLVFIAELALKRSRSNHRLPKSDIPSDITPEILAINDAMQRTLGESLEEADLAWLSDTMRFCVWQWDERLISSYQPSDRALRLAWHLEKGLSNRFGIRIDAETSTPLAILMETALQQARTPYPVRNPNETMVKTQAMDCFLMLTSVVHDTPDLERTLSTGANCARVALLLMEQLERADIQRRYRIGLVVNCGIDQAVFSKRRIAKLLPSIDIVKVIGEDDLPDDPVSPLFSSLRSQIDFLVSFTPLRIELPVITVSNAITERDVASIASFASQISRGATNDRFPSLQGPLRAQSLQELACALRGRVGDAFSGTNKEFAHLLAVQQVVEGDVMLFPLFCNSVRRTTMLGMPLECPVVEASHAAVLFVSEHDEKNLPFLVHRFKLYAKTLKDAKPSHEGLHEEGARA